MVVGLLDSDGHADGLDGVLYRWSDGDGHVDGLAGASYRWSHDGWSDRLVYMVDEWSDNVGRSFRINRLREKSHVKYRATRCITGMRVNGSRPCIW